MKINITGVVLAGGESSRMGEEKSLMQFKEQKLIEFSITALKPYCSEILISSSKNIHQTFSYRIIADEYHKIGPIAGIHSALRNSHTDFIIILPCDSPMVKSQFVEYLLSQIGENDKVIVPQYQSNKEPLFAIYHKSILPVIELQIKNQDYRLTHILDKVNAKVIEVTDRSCFVNINTPQDFNKYL